MAEQKLDPKVASFVNRFNAVILMSQACHMMYSAEGPPLELDAIKQIQAKLPDVREEFIRSDLALKALPHLLDIKKYANYYSRGALEHNKLCLFTELIRLFPPTSNGQWNALHQWAQQFKRDEAMQLLESLHKYDD
jgi:hypothetical protein